MIVNGDARAVPLADASVHCVVTSPPYWGLRDYGVPGQLGLERTPEEYVDNMVAVFREVWRVLRDDGTCWLNLGDSYAVAAPRSVRSNSDHAAPGFRNGKAYNETSQFPAGAFSLKPKDLAGMPWRVAFALQADGWYLRSDVIWSKPNPMPESVTDRPTKSHEYLFLLAKRERYYYDAEAIKERAVVDTAEEFEARKAKVHKHAANGVGGRDGRKALGLDTAVFQGGQRNRRTVWEIATQPYPEAHFATFPEALVEPCILAGTSERGACSRCGAPWERVSEDTPEYAEFKHSEKERRGGMRSSDLETFGLTRGTANKSVSAGRVTTSWRPTCRCIDVSEGIASLPDTTQPLVLDPFAGSGTVGLVCQRLGRRFVGLELKPDYCTMAYKRTAQMGLV